MKKLLAAISICLIATGAQANLIVNGGFEAPALQSNFETYEGQPNAIPGWIIDTGGVSLHTSQLLNTPAYEGNQYLDLVGFNDNYPNGLGSIMQSFSTVIGQQYVLRFAYAHVVFGVSNAAALFTVGDLSDTIAHNTGSPGNQDWRLYENTFTATNAVTTLRFENTVGNQSAGMTLDAVSVSDVPEPATWSFAIIGLGATGIAVRKQRRMLAA